MQTGTKIGLIGGGCLLLIGGTVIVGIVAFTVFNVGRGTERARELYRQRTAETVGTITNARPGTGRNVIYTFSYSVKGISYTGEDFGTRGTGDTGYLKRVGKPGRVCYDPADPSSSEFYADDYFPRDKDKGKPFCANTSH